LKETNDLHGHEVGNRLIVTAAKFIANTFKRSPVFRIGGDEFVAILRTQDLADCEKLMKQLDDLCAGEFIESDMAHIPVYIAKGFARYEHREGEQFADVFKRADEAMYVNKREMKKKQEELGS